MSELLHTTLFALEMDCVKGQVYLDKRRHAVSYAGQHPWLEHATIRDNILYGLPFNKARYEAVLDACALRPDLKIFEAGDQTGKIDRFNWSQESDMA